LYVAGGCRGLLCSAVGPQGVAVFCGLQCAAVGPCGLQCAVVGPCGFQCSVVGPCGLRCSALGLCGLFLVQYQRGFQCSGSTLASKSQGLSRLLLCPVGCTTTMHLLLPCMHACMQTKNLPCPPGQFMMRHRSCRFSAPRVLAEDSEQCHKPCLPEP
jgi:hypothetical protein